MKFLRNLSKIILSQKTADIFLWTVTSLVYFVASKDKKFKKIMKIVKIEEVKIHIFCATSEFQ